MTAVPAVFITAVVIYATICSTQAATRGVILTAPRSLEKNAVNEMYLYIYNIDGEGKVVISLKSMESDETLAQTEIDTPKAESAYRKIELKVPETSAYQMRLWINGTFETDDSYTVVEQDEVYFHSSQSMLTFIQTDKPIYKPGQTVKFRVLLVDRKLKPIGNNIKADIWVEDPSRSRIAQWKKVDVGVGIQQFKFPLSDEPNLGSWKITVDLGTTKESLYFDVKEYVLPKFEVTVTPPSYVLVNAETIPIKICAKYTYGKQVQGTLKVNSTMESYSWSQEKFPVYEIEDKIDGCFTFDLNVSLVDRDFSYSYRKIIVFAEVTEDGTGVVRNGTAGIFRSNNALKLEFLDDDYNTYFKPGIPYSKRIKVTKPDDTAAPNQAIQICATISRQRVLQKWWATRKVKYCRNYTSDENGIVLLKVPPQKPDTTNLYIEAQSLEAEEVPEEPRYYGYRDSIKPQIYQAKTSMTVNPYYSPSKNFIQIQNAGQTLECRSSHMLKILLTAKDGVRYNFDYMVIGRGKMLQKGTREFIFKAEDDVAPSMCKDSSSVNEVAIPIVPPRNAEENSSDDGQEDIDCSSGPIGAAEIDVAVVYDMSPDFRLLVYYIREDNEIVADSAKFEVEKCFQNKVDFQFGDEEKQPGTKTSVTLKASPNSLCGTKVLDKSISLLDSSDQLTRQRIFEELKKFDSQHYYHRDHCNDKFKRGEKNKMAQGMILPPRPWSTSQYADAVTAFEDCGFVVLSDLKMFTRPCSKGQNSYEGYGGVALASVGVRGGAAGAPVPYSTSFSRHRTKPMAERRRPVSAFSPHAESDSLNQAEKSGGGYGGATKSAVDIRSFFPETWLFEMESVGETGELISKATLPHTITEWIGNAVCINEEDGLGLSETARIRGFQAFFLGFTLPYSVIRGEKVPLIVSVFNYLDKCLPVKRTISVAVIADNGSVLAENSNSSDVCVCGGKSETFKYMFTPEHIGTLNLTVLAESASDSNVCGDRETASVIARDMATKALKVEAEGFPQEKVHSFLFCPEDYEGSTFTNKLELNIPNDAVEGSAKAFISVSGDIMGPTLDGLDHLVRLPTGCGEQNMVLFTPNIVALDYLKSVGKLTETMKTKAINNLKTGYQRELKYRHADGSYSAFGPTDREGSMWLSAFVLKSFSQAKRYIDIDEKDITETVHWILNKQDGDGCFPKVGKMFSEAMKGGVGSQDKTAPLSAYVLSALLVSGYANTSVTEAALTCIGKDTNLTPYTAALYGYTAALANSSEADRYLTWLSEKAIKEGDEVYWRSVNSSKSIDVETAAYAIISILNRKGDAGLSEALSIIRHLTKMRNARGGFISTQDTVVGIEAIALFASIISQDPVELNVKFNGGMLDETIVITEEDKLLMKKRRVPVVPSTVEITATGRGCGLILAAERYNTLEVPKQKYFTLSVSAERKADCKTVTLSACTSYVPEGQKSNMALMEIKMVSGFVAMKETLEELKNDKLRGSLMRFDIENNKVALYFDELENENKCFKFDVEQVSPVENTKPATITVYDYYAKEREESTDYNIEARTC